jgi:hypothetical protein
LETVFSLVAMDGEMRTMLKQEPVEGGAEFDAAFLQLRLESFIYVVNRVMDSNSTRF